MRIIVDEIPKEPKDCPYSETRKHKERQWVTCTKGSFVCEDTKQCKYLKSILDYKVDVYGNPVHGVIIEK